MDCIGMGLLGAAWETPVGVKNDNNILGIPLHVEWNLQQSGSTSPIVHPKLTLRKKIQKNNDHRKFSIFFYSLNI